MQREYVEVPPALLKKTAELKSYFAASLAFVKTMKPKGRTMNASTELPLRNLVAPGMSEVGSDKVLRSRGGAWPVVRNRSCLACW